MQLLDSFRMATKYTFGKLSSGAWCFVYNYGSTTTRQFVTTNTFSCVGNSHLSLIRTIIFFQADFIEKCPFGSTTKDTSLGKTSPTPRAFEGWLSHKQLLYTTIMVALLELLVDSRRNSSARRKAGQSNDLTDKNHHFGIFVLTPVLHPKQLIQPSFYVFLTC